MDNEDAPDALINRFVLALDATADLKSSVRGSTWCYQTILSSIYRTFQPLKIAYVLLRITR